MAIGTGTALLMGTVASAGIGAVGASKAAKAARPKEIQYNPIDPYADAEKAMRWNADNADTIESLISRSNRFSQDEALDLMERVMPGYSKLAESLTSQAQRKADNPYDMPKDVEQNLIRLANERGVSLGTGGQFKEFSLLRDLGVNSLQYGESNIQQAQQILGTLGSMAPRINPLSPASLWMDPQFAVGVAVDQNMAAHGQAQGAANAAAAASAQKWSALTNIGMNTAMAFGGYMANRPTTPAPAVNPSSASSYNPGFNFTGPGSTSHLTFRPPPGR